MVKLGVLYVQRIFVAFAFCQGALLFKVLENFVKSFIIHAAKVKMGTFAIQQSRKEKKALYSIFQRFSQSFFFFHGTWKKSNYCHHRLYFKTSKENVYHNLVKATMYLLCKKFYVEEHVFSLFHHTKAMSSKENFTDFFWSRT